MSTYLESVGIDWSEALADTDAFLSEVEAKIANIGDRLGTPTSTGGISALKAGESAAGLQADTQKVIAGLKELGQTVPKALSDLVGTSAKSIEAQIRTRIPQPAEQREYTKGIARGSANAANSEADAEVEQTAKELAAEQIALARKNAEVSKLKNEELAGDADYIANTALAAAAMARQAAEVEALVNISLEGDAEYRGWVVEGTVAGKQLVAAIEAEVNTRLNDSQDYKDNVTLGSVAAKELAAAIEADVQVFLADSGTYKANTALAAAAARQLAAAIEADTNEMLAAGGTSYAVDTARAAVKARELAAEVDKETLARTTTATLTTEAENAVTLELEALEKQAAIAQAELDASTGLLAKRVELGVLTEQVKVAFEQQLATARASAGLGGTQQLAAEQADLARKTAEASALKDEELAADARYIADTTRSAVAKAREAAQVEANVSLMLQADAQYQGWVVTGTVAAKQLAAAIEGDVNTRLAGSQVYEANTTRGTVAAKELAAAIEAEVNVRLVGSDAYKTNTARATVAARELAAAIEADVASRTAAGGGSTLAADTVRAAVSARELAAQIDKEVLARTTTATLTLEAENAVGLEVEALQQKAALARAELDASTGLLAGKVELEVLTEQLKIAYEQQLAVARASAGVPPGGPGGGSGGDESGGGGGGLFGSARLGRLVGFGLQGYAFFAIFNQIKSAVEDATKLQQVLAITEQQFQDLGRGTEFAQFRQGIQGIATSTGTLQSDVALIATQFQAAFGGDTTRALTETQSAMEAVRISGLGVQQVANIFLALDQSFAGTGTSVENLTDKAVGLQQRFGTLVADTLNFAASLAPVGAETGFTAQDLEALGAAFEEVSGKAGSGGAEQLGRVISGIQDKAVGLVTFLQANAPQIADSVAASLGQGDVKSALEDLLTVYPQLTAAQQQSLLATIGGRRETQTLVAIFKQSSQVLDELNGKYNDAGKANQTFQREQGTLGQQLKDLGAEFRSFANDLLNNGLGDALQAILVIVGGMVGAIDTLVKVFGKLNDVTGGLAGNLAGIAVALRGIQALAESTAITRLVTAMGIGSIGGTAIGGEEGASVGAAVGIGARLAKFNPLNAIGPARAAYGTQAVLNTAVEGTAAAEFTTAPVLAGAGAAFEAAGPGIVLVGGLIADKFIGYLSSGVQDHIDEHIRSNLGGKLLPESPGDVTALLQQNNVTVDVPAHIPGANAFENAKAGIVQRIDSTDALVNQLAASTHGFDDIKRSIESHASLWQQTLNVLPGGGRSQYIDLNKEVLNTSVKYVGTAVNSRLNDLSSNQELLKGFIDQINAAGGDANALFGGRDPKVVLEGLTQEYQKAGNDLTKLSGPDQQWFAVLSNLFGAGGPLEAAQNKIASDLKQQQDAVGRQGIAITDAQQAKSDFEAGLISLGSYLEALQKQQKALNTIASQSGDVKDVDAAAKNAKAIASTQSDALRQQYDLLQQASSLAGSATPQSEVGDLTALLNDPRFTDRADRLKATKDLVTALGQERQFELSQATTLSEKAAILSKSYAVPQAAQQELITAFLNSSVSFQQFLGTTLTAVGGLQDEIVGIVSQEMANGAKNVKLATENALYLEATVLANALKNMEKISPYLRNQKKMDAMFTEFVALMNELNQVANSPDPSVTVPDFSTSGPTPQDLKQAADDRRAEALAEANARLDIEAAQANGNAITMAHIAQERAQVDAQFAQSDADTLKAQAEMIAADNELAKALLESRNALRSLAEERAGSGSVEAASYAVAAALDALSLDQSGSTQAVQDLQKLEDAEHAFVKAQVAETTSILNAYEAQLINNGDPVGAAKLKLQDLKNQLANAQAEGLSPTEINNLQAQIIAQTGVVAQTQIQQGEQHIQTALALGRINKSQAIAQLQALKVYAINQDEIDQIDQEIKNLTGQLGQDFKFNLPSVLGLPTLYEARRLGQQPAGSGYQDNRVVTVQVFAQTNADPNQIAAAVAAVMGPPQTFSVAGRRY